MRQLPSNLLRNAHWQRQLIDCCSLPAPQISTQVLGRLYKESSGGTFQFKLNCGPLNLFSKRLCLISYASAPSEFLTCSREPPPFLQPSQQVPGCFFSLQRIWLIVMDFPAGKRIWSLERAGFVFSSKENQFRWLCLETQEGGKKEGKGERMGPGVTAIRGSLRQNWLLTRCHTCAPHTCSSTHTSRPTRARTHTRPHQRHRYVHRYTRNTPVRVQMPRHTHMNVHTPASSLLTGDVR